MVYKYKQFRKEMLSLYKSHMSMSRIPYEQPLAEAIELEIPWDICVYPGDTDPFTPTPGGDWEDEDQP